MKKILAYTLSLIFTMLLPITAYILPAIAVADDDQPIKTPSVLDALSQQWQTGEPFSENISTIKKLNSQMNACPNLSTPSIQAPLGLALLYSIPAHDCSAALRVYFQCANAIQQDAQNADQDFTAKVNGNYYTCSSWNIILALDKPATQKPVVSTQRPVILGVNSPISGSNYNGIFMPIAFTSNNAHIILQAWMFDPGAGGGSTNLGYDVQPITIIEGIKSFEDSIPAESLFYGNYKYAVYLDNSDKLPSFMQPGGPSTNEGKIVLENLTTGSSKILLEEHNTGYTLEKIDESQNILHFNVIHYTFDKNCPAEKDGELEDGALSCAKSTTVKRTLQLPK